MNEATWGPQDPGSATGQEVPNVRLSADSALPERRRAGGGDAACTSEGTGGTCIFQAPLTQLRSRRASRRSAASVPWSPCGSRRFRSRARGAGHGRCPLPVLAGVHGGIAFAGFGPLGVGHLVLWFPAPRAMCVVNGARAILSCNSAPQSVLLLCRWPKLARGQQARCQKHRRVRWAAPLSLTGKTYKHVAFMLNHVKTTIQ